MIEQDPQLTPADEADLVALADGNVDATRRAEIEARVAAEPALAAALGRQRAALGVLATACTVTMPPELRLRVAEFQALHAPARRRRWVAAAAAAVAAAATVVALLLGGGAPRVEDVVAVAFRPATAEARPAEQADGLRFPRYDNWRAVGARADVVGGRPTRTVFYERAGTRIAYTIVARPALAADPRRRLVTTAGRTAVTWTRHGRTCLIAGRGVDPAVLDKLAARR
jgi:anti-sigma factor RsiW